VREAGAQAEADVRSSFEELRTDLRRSRIKDDDDIVLEVLDFLTG